MESKPGGRRGGQGRPTAFKSDSVEGSALLRQEALDFLTPERMRLLVKTAYNRATGGGDVWIMAKVEWTGTERRLIIDEMKCKVSDGSTVWLYRERPDNALLKALIELGAGKAPTRSSPVQDTEIRVLTGVPRGRVARGVGGDEEDEG